MYEEVVLSTATSTVPVENGMSFQVAIVDTIGFWNDVFADLHAYNICTKYILDPDPRVPSMLHSPSLLDVRFPVKEKFWIFCTSYSLSACDSSLCVSSITSPSMMFHGFPTGAGTYISNSTPSMLSLRPKSPHLMAARNLAICWIFGKMEILSRQLQRIFPPTKKINARAF